MSTLCYKCIFSHQHISSVLAMKQPKCMVLQLDVRCDDILPFPSDQICFSSWIWCFYDWRQMQPALIINYFTELRGHLFLVIIFHLMKEGVQDQGTILWDSTIQANRLCIESIFLLLSMLLMGSIYLAPFVLKIAIIWQITWIAFSIINAHGVIKWYSKDHYMCMQTRTKIHVGILIRLHFYDNFYCTIIKYVCSDWHILFSWLFISSQDIYPHV